MPSFIESFGDIKKDTSNFKTVVKYRYNVIYKSLYMHESPCLKPDWLDDIRLFLMKNSNKLLYIKRSNMFPHIGSNETGR